MLSWTQHCCAENHQRPPQYPAGSESQTNTKSIRAVNINSSSNIKCNNKHKCNHQHKRNIN